MAALLSRCAWFATAPLFTTLATLGACGASAPPPVASTPRVPPDASSRAADTEPAPAARFLTAEATASRPEEAYDAAVGALEQALLGSERWARALDVPALHDPDRDFTEHQDLPPDRARVVVGIDRERVAARLAGITAAPWRPAAPAPLAASLEPVVHGALARLRCERVRALLDEGCAAPAAPTATTDASARPAAPEGTGTDQASGTDGTDGTDETDDAIAAQLARIAGTLRLRPLWEGGVPVAGGAPLRPVAVIAEHHDGRAWTPLPGLPVEISGGDAASLVSEPRAVTGADGIARLPLATGILWTDGSVRAQLDADTMLGPLADAWPVDRVALTMTARSVTEPGDARWRRWAIVVSERVGGRRAASPVFAGELVARRVGAGWAQPRALTADDRAALVDAAPTALAGRLPTLAESWRGRVDLVIVAEVDSDYASRMGTHRVWYEARARVRIYDAWTGRELRVIEESTSASGIGDERADAAARRALAAEVAAALARPAES